MLFDPFLLNSGMHNKLEIMFHREIYVPVARKKYQQASNTEITVKVSFYAQFIPSEH